jgi:hypothetical protein
MKIGDIIVAKDPCLMDDGHKALTIGQGYEIKELTHTSFFILDDEDELHEFVYEMYDQFFDEPKKDYENIIHELKEEIWKQILNLPTEKSSRVVEMQERTIFDEGDNYRFIIEDGELYDKIFKEKISYTEMCIEDLNYLLEQWEQEIQ